MSRDEAAELLSMIRKNLSPNVFYIVEATLHGNTEYIKISRKDTKLMDWKNDIDYLYKADDEPRDLKKCSYCPNKTSFYEVCASCDEPVCTRCEDNLDERGLCRGCAN